MLSCRVVVLPLPRRFFGALLRCRATAFALLPCRATAFALLPCRATAFALPTCRATAFALLRRLVVRCRVPVGLVTLSGVSRASVFPAVGRFPCVSRSRVSVARGRPCPFLGLL